VAHDGHVVSDQHDREPEPLAKFEQQLEHGHLHGNVERRDRLVRYQQLRLQRERTGEAHALALAARELVRIGIEGIRPKVDEREQLATTRLDRPGRHELVNAEQLDECLTDGAAGLSDVYGSWKTIWILRRSARLRRTPSG
jgi:hypothetical protein